MFIFKNIQWKNKTPKTFLFNVSLLYEDLIMFFENISIEEKQLNEDSVGELEFVMNEFMKNFGNFNWKEECEIIIQIVKFHQKEFVECEGTMVELEFTKE